MAINISVTYITIYINGIQAGVFKNDWLRTDSVTYTNTEWTVFIVYRIIEFNAESIDDSGDTIFDLKSNANLEWRNSLSGIKCSKIIILI